MNTRTNKPACSTRSIGCLLAGLVGIPIFLILLYFSLRALGGYLIVSDSLSRSEAIVVLSGGGNARLEEAGRLYKEELADKLILTETGDKVQGYNQDYSFYLKLKMLNMEIPPTAIFVTDEHARNTYDEAVAVLDLMKKHKYFSCIVITDPYHTRRTRMVFQRVFTGSDIDVRIWPVTTHWYRSSNWFLTPRGWLVTLTEYASLVAYRLGIYRL